MRPHRVVLAALALLVLAWLAVTLRVGRVPVPITPGADDALLRLTIERLLDGAVAVNRLRRPGRVVYVHHETVGLLELPIAFRVNAPVRGGQMLDSILSRNARGSPVTMADTERLRVVDLDTVNHGFRDTPKDFAYFVRPTLPGYSKDGLVAVVFFYFGPSESGAIVCCVLSRPGLTEDWGIESFIELAFA